MAKSALQIEIEGLVELQKKAIQLIADMHGDDIANAMRDSVILMQRRAMQPPPGGYYEGAKAGYIPVDTGRLRASLTPVVRSRGPIIQGIVGTNVEYGPYQEFGTKRGVRALKYMQTTMKEVRAEIQAKFNGVVKLIVKRRPR